MYGQALTVKTICSREEDVSKHMSMLHVKFIERGYPVKLVDENLARGSLLECTDLFRPKPIYPSQANLVPSASKP